MGCFRLNVLKRGLKMVFTCSTGLLAGLLAGFTLASQKILALFPGFTGVGISVGVGFALIPAAALILHVVLDSAIALRDPSYFSKRGLEVCA